MSRLTPAERLSRKLVPDESGCLVWSGAKYPKGYGQIYVDGKIVRTHRLAWELANGPIPEGLGVLHRCDNPPCCNVEHLFLGTSIDNNADRDAKGRHAESNKTHCPSGHAYDSTNTRIDSNGWRVCRKCKREADTRNNHRRRGAPAQRTRREGR